MVGKVVVGLFFVGIIVVMLEGVFGKLVVGIGGVVNIGNCFVNGGELFGF